MLQLKKPELEPEASDRQVRATVEAMLEDIGRRGEAAIRELAPAQILSRKRLGFRSL